MGEKTAGGATLGSTDPKPGTDGSWPTAEVLQHVSKPQGAPMVLPHASCMWTSNCFSESPCAENGEHMVTYVDSEGDPHRGPGNGIFLRIQARELMQETALASSVTNVPCSSATCIRPSRRCSQYLISFRVRAALTQHWYLLVRVLTRFDFTVRYGTF